MTAITTDRDEIVRVVQLYIDGFNHRDVNKFKEAFHEKAWIFFTDAEGVLHEALLTDYFEEWAASNTPEIKGRFISVEQAGDVAVVILGFDHAADMSPAWVDIHSLLKINSVWKIMNKTATHCSRAGEAGTKESVRKGSRVQTAESSRT